MDPRVADLVRDARLTDAARVVGFYVASLGGDWHEIPKKRFQTLLHEGGSVQKVKDALRQLALYDYIERKSGGRGHADRYTFAFSSMDGGSAKDLGERTGVQLKDSGTDGGSAKSPHARESRSVSLNGVEVPSSATTTLGDAAERALKQHNKLLNGCRGSLRDYLVSRVKPGRQAAYIHSIAGWLNGLTPNVWQLPDGTALDEGERTAALAAALNELAASDEQTMKRPVGDPANLKTKLSILLRQRGDRPWGWRRAPPEGRDGRRTPMHKRPDELD